MKGDQPNMTVTMDEFKDFIKVYENQGIEKTSDEDLRKAIRHFWNVASQPTVDDRINTLKGEGYIERIPHSESWKINYDKNDTIEKVFSNAGKQ